MTMITLPLPRSLVRFSIALVAIVSLSFFSTLAAAAPPMEVAYQGRLLDPAGEPVEGVVSVEIGIWDQESFGTRLYEETHAAVAVDAGVFHLKLGTGEGPGGGGGAVFNANLFSGPRYLELIIDGERLTPRQAFASTPYALQAARDGADVPHLRATCQKTTYRW
jgi:hypothetical protein